MGKNLKSSKKNKAERVLSGVEGLQAPRNDVPEDAGNAGDPSNAGSSSNEKVASPPGKDTVRNDELENNTVDETIDPASCIKCAESGSAQMRALADYQNLVRETAKQRMEFVKYASQGLVEDLLPTLDYFDAAMNSKPNLEKIDEAERKVIDNWIMGIAHVQKLMMDTLTQQGVTIVDTSGNLDTSLHEAVEEKGSKEPEGKILSVVANGYRMGDKLLRPARVIVSKGK